VPTILGHCNCQSLGNGGEPVLGTRYEVTYGSGPDWMRRLDRISKTMKSGRSVSVALRRRDESKETLNVLDITIDPHGKPPSPDLG
jgi:hypothetical protein